MSITTEPTPKSPTPKPKESPLATTWIKIREYFKGSLNRSTVIFLVVVGVLIAGYFGYQYYQDYQDGKSSNRWTALLQYKPSSPKDREDQLVEIRKKFKGTVPAQIAKLLEARSQLNEGLRDVYSQESESRKAAHKALEKSAVAFEQLAKDLDQDEHKLLIQQCIFDSAQAYEGLGKWDQALKQYEKLETNYQGAIADRAKEKRTYIKANLADLKKLTEELKPENADR